MAILVKILKVHKMVGQCCCKLLYRPFLKILKVSKRLFFI